MLASVIAWALPTLLRVTSEDIRVVQAASLQSRSPGAKPLLDSRSVLTRPLCTSVHLKLSERSLCEWSRQGLLSADFFSAEVNR